MNEQLSKLNEYCTEWDLSQPVHISSTQTSDVYRVNFQGKVAVLKILNSIGKKYESNGPVALKCFNGHGAVDLLNANAGAQLLEYADGRNLRDLVEGGNDEFATQNICEVLTKLHSFSREFPSGIPTLREHFRALFAAAAIEPDSIYAKGARVAENLLASEKDLVLLHGDIHHRNIIESTTRGWLAIDPQCVVGERTYDTANSFFNPDDMPSIVEAEERVRLLCRIFSEKLKFDSKRVLEFAFVHGCLSSVWCNEDGQNPESRLRITKLIHRLLLSDEY